VELYLHSPHTSSWRGAQLKHREDFTLLPTSGSKARIRYGGEVLLFFHRIVLFLKMNVSVETVKFVLSLIDILTSI
jgi:hypothetical protein